jgi:hypothetical protein
MSYSPVIAAYIEGSIWALKDAGKDQQQAWDVFVNTGDLLHAANNGDVVDTLIEQISDPDLKVAALSILFIGTMHELGADARKAIPTIRAVIPRSQSGPFNIACSYALAVLGDREFIDIRTEIMRKTHVEKIYEYQRKCIASVIYGIADPRLSHYWQ